MSERTYHHLRSNEVRPWLRSTSGQNAGTLTGFLALSAHWGESHLILYVSFLILFIATLTYSTTIGRQSQGLPAEDTLLPQIGRIATWRLVDERKFLRSNRSPPSGKKTAQASRSQQTIGR